MTVVGLLLFEGCDVMDVTGPYEVFHTADRLCERWVVDLPFQVRTVTLDGRPVTAYGGLGLVPGNGSLTDNLQDLHVLVVPGLIDIEAGVGDRVLVEAIAGAAGRVRTMASVCTGAFLLEAAGVLGDLPATTHWEDVALLASRRSGGAVRDDVRWVDAGRVVTAGGLSSGIAMALHMVQDVAGRELAEATARQLDYVWTEHR